MRRRLEKEQEAYAGHHGAGGGASDEADGAYPALPSDLAADEAMKQKLEQMPTPPPHYPDIPSSSGDARNRRGKNYNDDGDADERQRLSGGEDDDYDVEPGVSNTQMMIDAGISLLLDVGLMVAELVINFWLAMLLRDQERSGHYTAAILLIFAPSIFNALIWFRLSKSYRGSVSILFMLAVVFIGFPSPLLVYVWHIYLTVFCLRTASHRSRVLANTFRVVQAFSMSLPLILLNIYTLLSVLHKDDENLDLSRLIDHLAEGINVRIHGLAAMISFINILRAATLYNERTTFSLLFVMVSFPFLLFTILSRIIALSVISCFLEYQWTILLFLGLVLTNLALYYACRKRAFSPGSSTSSLIEQAHYNVAARHKLNKVDPTTVGGGEQPPQQQLFHMQHLRGKKRRSSIEDSMENVDCCCGPTTAEEKGLQGRDLMVVSSDYEMAGDSFWESLPKSFLLSICSSVIPVGYTNDRHSHHPLRLKGGMFVLLNFFFNTVWIGLALGFTIVHNVPNNVQGISIPQPSVKVEVPGSKVFVQAAGLDLSLNLPNTKLDLGSMPKVSANLNLVDNDAYVAIFIPILLAGLAVPFVVMRAVMMELDCFVAHKKDVDPVTGNRYSYSPSKRRRHQRSEALGISQMVRENNADRELKSRLYVTICCSMMGMCIFTVMLLVATAYVAMSLLG